MRHCRALVLFFLGVVFLQPLRAWCEESAQASLARAEQRAKNEGKNVLVTFGASWCSNCRLFDRMLEDPAVGPILAKAFVHIDLTTGERPDDKRHTNTPGGLEVQNRLGGNEAGWPYFAMLNPQGKMLTDSFRPSKGRPHAENVGYPATREEIDWFGKMLQTAAPMLTASERTAVTDWLRKHRPA